VTDEAHTPPGSAGAPGPGSGTRVLPAARRGLERFGRWLAAWGRRLAPSPFLWVGVVLGFGTSLLVWESVLLLGVVVWLLGVWFWRARASHVLVALGLGMVLGWLPMLFFFVSSLPHTMIGLPGVEYDL
jgi:hypothetical protein